MDKLYISAIILILTAIFLTHLYTLRFNTLLEPDNFIYLSVAQHYLNNQPFNLACCPYSESYGLIIIILIFSGFLGSIYITMLFIAPIFAVLDALVIGLLAWELCKDKRIVILALIFFLLLPNYKAMAGEFRGESIVPFFVGLAMLLFIYHLKDASLEFKIFDLSAGFLFL